ncbi:hypothetical protein EUAN_13510 [Andreesenia angusta]|uniref:Uncharacterized protein n=1 Tax=Andreesenia angusta TaxID=39480 RepID=A0A1S1V6K9_9FIRM|nr:hypothetical protein [Andreesenia angusta]OHW62281.1 hypothetical protein EUAN_13510 [Andreesenia angusta]
MFNGLEYRDLSNVAKTICLSCDFYEKTKGNWNTKDLIILKFIFSSIGLPVSDTTTYEPFFEGLLNEYSLLERLQKLVDYHEVDLSAKYRVPLILGISKADLIQSKENYIVDSLVTQMRNFNKDFTRNEARKLILEHYIKEELLMNLKSPVANFDLALEVLCTLDFLANKKILNLYEFGYKYYFRYKGTEVNYSEDMKCFEMAAAQGYIDAQYMLG